MFSAATKSGQQPTATDPYFNYVTALLHGDGTNGGQNNTFLDSSSNNFTITRNGNTSQGSYSPYGSLWSNYFDGNGDYLSFADNTAFAVGSGDWTLEAWVYLNSYSGTSSYGFIYDGRPSATNGYYLTLYQNNGTVRFFTNGGSVINSDTGTVGTIALGTWTHVAVCKSGSSTKMFLNGSQVGSTYTDTNTYINGTARPLIGANANTIGDYINGYVSNLRLVKGTALYTANFTPSTTPLTAVTNTSLLTCQSNRFIDNSSNAFTITVNGDVRVTNFAPFLPTAAYSTSTNGGSAYFDGAGDYLETTNSYSVGTGDVTVEGWMYHTGFSSGGYNSVFALGSLFLMQYTSGTLCMYVGNGSGSGQLAYTLPSANWLTNRWTHFVVVRSGTSWAMFLDGTRVSTNTNSNNLSSAPLRVGCDATGTTYPMLGYISNLKLTVGSALYSPASSTITIPTSPATSSGSTSLLLNFTNGAIFDNSMKNDLETVGNAQISTSVKKYGTGSLAFDGSGDYLQIANSDLLSLSGDYTIEMWLYVVSTPSSPTFFQLGSTSNYLLWYVASATKYPTLTGSVSITSSAAISLGTWNHIALVRSGTGTNNTVMYLNGVSVGQATNTTSFVGSASNGLRIGAEYPTGFELNGYIDDLRITKGVARYTANFTPPTAAFPNQ